MKKVLSSVLGALFALGVAAPKASAVTLIAGAENEAFFNNFEVLLDASGNIRAADATPEVGNHLFGIFNVQNIDANGGTNFFAGATDQLTGVFSQKIIGISADPGTGILHLTLGNPTLSTYAGISSPFSSGEMFRLYTQTGGGTTPFESNGTIADDVTKATDGALWATLGLDATNGLGVDGIPGTPDDTGYAYSHPVLGPNLTGEAWGGLTFKINNTGYAFDGINDVNETEIGGTTLLNQFVFSSEFELNQRFTQGVSPWEFASNDPAKIHPSVVPEVSSLWMLGMGLSGFGVFRRRKTA